MSSNSARLREHAALSLCASTVPLAYFTRELSAFTFVLLLLAFIWIGTSGWLSGQWRWLMGKSWRQLRVGYLAGEMPRLTPTARVLCAGGVAFSVAYFMLSGDNHGLFA